MYMLYVKNITMCLYTTYVKKSYKHVAIIIQFIYILLEYVLLIYYFVNIHAI